MVINIKEKGRLVCRTLPEPPTPSRPATNQQTEAMDYIIVVAHVHVHAHVLVHDHGACSFSG